MTVIPADLTVADPASLGIDTAKLDELRARVRREVDDGLLPSCQWALARHGRLVAFETFGPRTNDTRYGIFSATKALVASTVWQLIAEGSIDVSRRVADLIPEFATNGKDGITIEQVMLHTSGFPLAPLGPPAWDTSAGRREAFGRWRLNWEPGTAYEYHATSAHWVLAELIETVTGQDFRDVVHARVTEPLGLPRILGLALDDQDGIADLELCGEHASAEELKAAFGIEELPVGEVTDQVLLQLNRPEARVVGLPGGGGVTTAAVVALFYQGLLHNQAGLWDPEVLADATGTVRNDFPDPLTHTPANRALGVIVAGDDGRAPFRGFGHTQSPRTFGHNGAGGQIAWADPDSGLSFCYLTNGNDLHELRQPRRGIGISSRAAVCVRPGALTSGVGPDDDHGE
ncbi:MAG TPA: serine hydrolase domain-containing protein [Acidimicrobiales bacterium]|nr:serine hydrolase domain-containing protein [Acidimicrobiales bacterium]